MMKLETLEIGSCMEVEAGMIVEWWATEGGEPWIILNRLKSVDQCFLANVMKVEEIRNEHGNKFWAVPMSNPGIPPVLICLDLLFDRKTPRFYRVVK